LSGTLAALQDLAQTAADAFCRRYVQPRSRKGRQHAGQYRSRDASSHDPPAKTCPERRRRIGKFYRRRDHEASPFFKVVRDYFDEFERVYPERYQKVYGYWRPVVRSSIVTSFCFARYMGFQPNFIKFLRGDKFLKPAVSLSNRAAISKRALPEYVALTVKLNFLLHSHAGNEGSARVADRSAPSCLPIGSKKKCLPMCRIVSGYSACRED
jgi:hypothetical protein